MSEREYAEDTAFWSLKPATTFSARRRTVHLFLASPKPGTLSAYSWIDNTPTVWKDLTSILEAQNPKTIVVNVDSTIAFAGGLHVGELEEMKRRLYVYFLPYQSRARLIEYLAAARLKP